MDALSAEQALLAGDLRSLALGSFLLEAKVGGKQVAFQLDTGADVMVLTAETAATIGLGEPDTTWQVRRVGERRPFPAWSSLPIEVCGRVFHLPAVRAAGYGRNLLPRTLLKELYAEGDGDAADLETECLALGSIEYEMRQRYELSPDLTEEARKTAESRWADFLQKTEDVEEPFRTKLRELMWKYREVWENPKVGNYKTLASFKVEGEPKRARLRHYDDGMMAEMKRQLDAMLDAGVIRKSDSPWASAPHFVPKKTGEWRMVLDYQEVNKCMTPDAYPIPLLWDHVRRSAHKIYYITLDCNNGFWALGLEEASKPYTAIITPWGLYEFNVLPFGIRNSTPIFQRAMDETFEGCLNDDIMVYVDDIIISGDDVDTMLGHLETVCRRCLEAGLYVRLDKCEWLKGPWTTWARSWASTASGPSLSASARWRRRSLLATARSSSASPASLATCDPLSPTTPILRPLSGA